jgi:hypothetical protein
MMDATPPRNLLATFLSYVPVIGQAGRFIAEERFIALTLLTLAVLAALVAIVMYFGPIAMIYIADAMALIAGLVILALTRDG